MDLLVEAKQSGHLAACLLASPPDLLATRLLSRAAALLLASESCAGSLAFLVPPHLGRRR